MRELLSKPLVILAAVLLVFGAIFIYWLASGPSAAAGSDNLTNAPHQRQVDRVMDQIDNQR